MKNAVATALAGTAGVAAQPAPDGAITPAEIETAARLSGRRFTLPERELMARRAGGSRERLTALRAADLRETDEPATYFDPRVRGVRLPRGKSACRMSAGRAPAYAGDIRSLAFAPVTELSRLLRARKITSTELTRMYLERLKRFGPRLLCVVTITEDLALEQAARADRETAGRGYRGPMHGIPWGAKDLLATKGIRTTWGARPYAEQVFDYDAAVVQRLEAAGAVLVAKLSMGELAMGDVWFGGRTRNPWNASRGSSGSSAGSGSATAAGLVGFAIGTETHGSIVSPCVENGVTGLRPTYGRVPRTGAMTLCWTLDKIGPICRGVEDCALVLAAIHGPDGSDRTVAGVPFRWDPRSNLADLRVGIDSSAFDAMEKDKARRETYASVLTTLRGLGLDLKPVKLPVQTPAYRALVGTTIDVESAASFARLTESGRLDLLAQQGAGNWPNTFRIGSTIPAVDYLQALRVRRRLQDEMARVFDDIDLYVTVPFAGPTMAYTNLTGNPTVVTRCGMRDGRPESVEFVGALYREDAILRVAHAYERATDWRRVHPDVDKLPVTPP